MEGIGGTLGLWIGIKATEEWELSLGEWVKLSGPHWGEAKRRAQGLEKNLDKWRKCQTVKFLSAAYPEPLAEAIIAYVRTELLKNTQK